MLFFASNTMIYNFHLKNLFSIYILTYLTILLLFTSIHTFLFRNIFSVKKISLLLFIRHLYLDASNALLVINNKHLLSKAIFTSSLKNFNDLQAQVKSVFYIKIQLWSPATSSLSFGLFTAPYYIFNFMCRNYFSLCPTYSST